MIRTTISRWLQLVTKRTDLMLGMLLMMIIFLMILPLPVIIVDALIATNMSLAVLLLMTSIYIKSPVEFTSFPSVLLLTTLFRLALAITTTRLVLLQADAGKIIQTFGEFVVGGNIVVGLVIFLIITIVQFLVITKGSERVAEVSARFSLDAMPGKQMSIDGDMRAGVIDQKEAQNRRNKVQKESQLYGSMDGAMKFVKGDAIAGIIIAFVNLIGGMAVGILQHGMTASQSIHVYSILTIGDGLVSQIPALLISITSGMIVTRVSDDDDEQSSNLGVAISTQLSNHPRALMIGGVLLLTFAALPGFPTTIFLTLATLLGGGGYLSHWRKSKPKSAIQRSSIKPGDAAATPEAGEGEEGKEEFSLTVPLLIDVAIDLQELISEAGLENELTKIRQALYLDMGIPFPGIHLRFNESIEPGTYEIQLQEIPVATGHLKKGYLLANEDPKTLNALKIKSEKGSPFLPGKDSLWVQEKYKEKLEKSGISYMDTCKIISYHLSYVLKGNADSFMGIQETRFLIEKMEGSFPELIKEVQRLLPIQKITDILQRLVSEDISIRNLKTIFESMIEWGQKEKDVVQLTEYIRGSLKNYICYKYSNGQNVIATYMIDPKVEEIIRDAIRQTSGGSYLALDSSVSQAFIDEVKKTVGDITKMEKPPVLMVSMDIRRYVRKLLEGEMDDLPVMSFQEMTRKISAQPLGRIKLNM